MVWVTVCGLPADVQRRHKLSAPRKPCSGVEAVHVRSACELWLALALSTHPWKGAEDYRKAISGFAQHKRWEGPARVQPSPRASYWLSWSTSAAS